MTPKALTTGQVAAMLNCAPRTVATWCNTGLLASHRLPGGGHRRVFVADVVRFCAANGVPVPEELAGAAAPPPFVLVGAARDEAARFVAAVQAVVHPDANWHAGSLIDVAMEAGTRWPDVVLLGCDEGLDRAVQAAAVLLGLERPAPRVLLVVDDATDPADARLDAVRDRLAWVGRTPGDWQEAVQLGLTPRSGSEQEVEAAAPARARRPPRPGVAGVGRVPGEALGPG